VRPLAPKRVTSAQIRKIPIESELPIALLKKLYVAKCTDLQLPMHEEQEERFYQFCKLVISNRKIKLTEQGLGVKSAAVISKLMNLPQI
jgi:hypothetical protein